MKDEKNHTNGRKGPIERTIEWTMAIIFIAIILGASWKYVIHPLFFGWY